MDTKHCAYINKWQKRKGKGVFSFQKSLFDKTILFVLGLWKEFLVKPSLLFCTSKFHNWLYKLFGLSYKWFISWAVLYATIMFYQKLALFNIQCMTFEKAFVSNLRIYFNPKVESNILEVHNYSVSTAFLCCFH